MNLSIIRVVARLSTRHDAVDSFKAAAANLIHETRKEQGCLSYELVQNLTDPTDFNFLEQWADKPALDAHMGSPHLAAALKKVGPMLAAPPDIRRYSTVI